MYPRFLIPASIGVLDLRVSRVLGNSCCRRNAKLLCFFDFLGFATSLVWWNLSSRYFCCAITSLNFFPVRSPSTHSETSAGVGFSKDTKHTKTGWQEHEQQEDVIYALFWILWRHFTWQPKIKHNLLCLRISTRQIRIMKCHTKKNLSAIIVNTPIGRNW